ncbi:MAG: hypothetical protein ACLRZ6_01965 [Lachnospiraceae bacterium]
MADKQQIRNRNANAQIAAQDSSSAAAAARQNGAEALTDSN